MIKRLLLHVTRVIYVIRKSALILLHWYIVLSISECGNLLFRFDNAINLDDLPAGWCAEFLLGGA
jgi:hypothetical protein